MIYSSVFLAAEDSTGLAIGRKLVANAKPLTVYREYNGRGFGRLKANVESYCEMGRQGLPVLMFTDLDDAQCAPLLIDRWLGEKASANFLFRVCIREVESWLLGHRMAIAELLRIPPSRVPTDPEALPDPKAALIHLAQRSPARIKRAVTPIGTATIGPGYNDLMEEFIRTSWEPDVAEEHCPSLLKARLRIAELAGRVSR
jgi:hypothetical protein